MSDMPPPIQAAHPHAAAPGSDAAMLMRYDANKRSTLIAYLLWFFVGIFGVHRFYLKRTGSAIAQLVITLISIPLAFIGIGVFGYLIVGIWVLVDAFLIPGMVRGYNNALISRLEA
ncbi:MAG: TM2 domain-containing protein [Rhodospirillales bacterium]|nr:TM2 domain-containing protein [Rhodospirillales bacterium]